MALDGNGSRRVGQQSYPLPRDAAALAPLVRVLTSAPDAVSDAMRLDACITLRCVAKENGQLLLQSSGCLLALVAASSSSEPAKLRGWALSAIALLARGSSAGSRAVLASARHALLNALSLEPESQTWAAETLISLCSRSSGAAPLVHAGAVSRLLGVVRPATHPPPPDSVRAATHAALRALTCLAQIAPARVQLCAVPHALSDVVSLVLSADEGVAESAAQLLRSVLGAAGAGGDAWAAACALVTSEPFARLVRRLALDDEVGAARSLLLCSVVLAVSVPLSARRETAGFTLPPPLDLDGVSALRGHERLLLSRRPPHDALTPALQGVCATLGRIASDAFGGVAGHGPGPVGGSHQRPGVDPRTDAEPRPSDAAYSSAIARAGAEWRQYKGRVAAAASSSAEEHEPRRSASGEPGADADAAVAVKEAAARAVAAKEAGAKAAAAAEVAARQIATLQSGAERLRLVVSFERRERAAERSAHQEELREALGAAEAEAKTERERVEASAAEGASRAAAAARKAETDRLKEVLDAHAATKHARAESRKLEQQLESAAAELTKAAALTSGTEVARRAAAARARALEVSSAKSQREAARAEEARRAAEQSLAAEAAARERAERRAVEVHDTAALRLRQAGLSAEEARAQLGAATAAAAAGRVELAAASQREEALEGQLQQQAARRREAEAAATRAACEAGAAVGAAWLEAAEWRHAADARERAVAYLAQELEQTHAQLARLATGIETLAAPREPSAGLSRATAAHIRTREPVWRGAGGAVATTVFADEVLVEATPAPMVRAAEGSPPPSALPIPLALRPLDPNTVRRAGVDPPRKPAALSHYEPMSHGPAPGTPRQLALRATRRQFLKVLTGDRDALRRQIEQMREQSAALAIEDAAHNIAPPS